MIFSARKKGNALENFNTAIAAIRNMWNNPRDWQRRICLVLVVTFWVLPATVFFGLIMAFFALFYLPFMVMMGGWTGYNTAVSQLSDTVCDPVVDVLYMIKGIWIRARTK